MDEIAVVRCSTGTDEDGADITFDFNGKRMKVSLFPMASTLEHKSPTENRLICLLGKSVEADSDEYEDIMDKVIQAILDAGRPLFIKAAPPSTASDGLRARTAETITVQSYLFPETIDFRFQTINSIPTVFPIHSDEANTLPDVGPDPDFEPDSYRIDMKLPRYSAADLVPLQVLLEGGNFMAKVEIDGRDMVCKAFCQGLEDPGLIQELASISLIQQKAALEGGSGLSNTQIRVPKLVGYITHAETGATLGMLREWIPAGNRGDTLRDVDVSTVSVEIRQRWAEQIRGMVNWLHEIDIVWGDGKPSNVVIDQADNAWLIDFGGGWTEGWVDEEFAGTERGDDQAVERIAKFLGL